MRSLIILRGLSKSDKDAWLRKERLLNFYIDLETLRNFYYKPEYKGGRDFLVRSMDDTVYRRMIEILISRMNGTLVVLDWGLDSTVAIEQLCKVLGYTVFYKVFQTPRDYLSNTKKYQDPRYLPKSRDQMKQAVEKFKEQDFTDKNLINSYSDLENYWKKELTMYDLKSGSTVLHVSDLHSHWSVLESIILPKTRRSGLTVFLGDYVDGPEPSGSRKILDYILSEKREKIIFLEGNHEFRLRKYLGWKVFRSGKRILSESLFSDIPTDFLENTSSQFDDLDATESWRWIEELNSKLKEFVIYQRDSKKFICSHCGCRWLEQISPKYIGNLINTNKYVERTDEFFSKKYSERDIYSIHGHCHYLDALPDKYPRVFNLDPPDEKSVLIMEGKPNFKFNVRCLEQDN